MTENKGSNNSLISCNTKNLPFIFNIIKNTIYFVFSLRQWLFAWFWNFQENYRERQKQMLKEVSEFSKKNATY